MAAIEFARPAPFGSITVFRAVTLVERLAAKMAAIRATRQSHAALRSLPDSLLDDLGLSRGDIARF